MWMVTEPGSAYSHFMYNTVSKVFEKEVFCQVYGYLTENCMLSKFQSGFRPEHCTVTALIQMCDEWLENMDNGKLNGVVFLDIKKAFDSINHGILLNKMKKRFGISSIELKWFESYLSCHARKYVFHSNGSVCSSLSLCVYSNYLIFVAKRRVSFVSC